MNVKDLVQFNNGHIHGNIHWKMFEFVCLSMKVQVVPIGEQLKSEAHSLDLRGPNEDLKQYRWGKRHCPRWSFCYFEAIHGMLLFFV